mgnify:CR=1 FL=1
MRHLGATQPLPREVGEGSKCVLWEPHYVTLLPVYIYYRVHQPGVAFHIATRVI